MRRAVVMRDGEEADQTKDRHFLPLIFLMGRTPVLHLSWKIFIPSNAVHLGLTFDGECFKLNSGANIRICYVWGEGGGVKKYVDKLVSQYPPV